MTYTAYIWFEFKFCFAWCRKIINVSIRFNNIQKEKIKKERREETLKREEKRRGLRFIGKGIKKREEKGIRREEKRREEKRREEKRREEKRREEKRIKSSIEEKRRARREVPSLIYSSHAISKRSRTGIRKIQYWI